MYLRIYVSVYRYIYIYMNTWKRCTTETHVRYLYIYTSIYISIYIYIYVSMYLLIYVSMYWFIYICICIGIHEKNIQQRHASVTAMHVSQPLHTCCCALAVAHMLQTCQKKKTCVCGGKPYTTWQLCVLREYIPLSVNEYTCIHVYMCIYTLQCTYIHIYVYIYTWWCVSNVNVCLSVGMHIYIYMHMYTLWCTYIHTYVYIYTL